MARLPDKGLRYHAYVRMLNVPVWYPAANVLTLSACAGRATVGLWKVLIWVVCIDIAIAAVLTRILEWAVRCEFWSRSNIISGDKVADTGGPIINPWISHLSNPAWSADEASTVPPFTFMCSERMQMCNEHFKVPQYLSIYLPSKEWWPLSPCMQDDERPTSCQTAEWAERGGASNGIAKESESWIYFSRVTSIGKILYVRGWRCATYVEVICSGGIQHIW